jgi:hypothetical protein
MYRVGHMNDRGARKLLMSGLVVVLAACSPAASTAPSTASAATASLEPAPTPNPAAATSPSPAASPTSSPTPSFGTPQVFPPGAAVAVAVAELNVRANPTTTAKRIVTLKRGELLIISPTDQLSFGWGPVKANGYTWYPVMRPRGASTTKLDPLPKAPLDVADGPPVAGWAASDNGKAPFLLAVAPRCPTTIDLASVEGMLPAERLACFGKPFELTGTFGCGGCGGEVAGEFKPFWLASTMEFDFLSLKPATRLGPLAVRFPPDGPSRPAAGSIVRVKVHVDDPRSSTCTMSEPTNAGTLKPVNSGSAIAYCRERLVVESIVVLGTDPSFPPG